MSNVGKLALVAALVPLLFAAAPAEARTLGLGVHLGYQKSNDGDGNYLVGGNASWRPFSLLGALLEVGYRQEDFDVGGRESGFNKAEVDYIPVLLSLQVFPFGDALGALSPYAMGGVGWYVARSEVKGTFGTAQTRFKDYDSSTGFHFGFGSDLHLGDSVTLCGDFRYVFLDTELEDVEDIDADGIQLTLGLKLFLF